MKPAGSLLIAALALAAACGSPRAQTAQSTPPIEIAQLPFIEIFSPTFFWSDEADFTRIGSITCPKGRAITGGLNIVQGAASLRIQESYPDGKSWVIRVVSRQKTDKPQSLQVRGFALCMLPAARKASVLLAQHAKLIHASSKFAMPPGFASTTGRQSCPKNSPVIAGGFGLDPQYRGPAVPRLEQSYPDPDGWNVRAVNGAAGIGPADARAYAVCLGPTNGPGLDVRAHQTVFFAEADVPVKFGDGRARQAVSCKEADSYVLSGGARTVRGRKDMIEIEESFPDSQSSWTVSLVNRGDKKSGDVTVRLYAVCIKK